MKVGELLNVDIQGITVTQGMITDMDNESVTVQIPGTEVVIAIRQSLTDETPEYVPEVDRVLLDDTQKPANTEPPVPPPAAPVVIEEGKSLKEMHLDSSGVD